MRITEIAGPLEDGPCNLERLGAKLIIGHMDERSGMPTVPIRKTEGASADAAPRYNIRTISEAISVVTDPHIASKVTPRHTTSSTSPVVYLCGF